MSTQCYPHPDLKPIPTRIVRTEMSSPLLWWREQGMGAIIISQFLHIWRDRHRSTARGSRVGMTKSEATLLLLPKLLPPSFIQRGQVALRILSTSIWSHTPDLTLFVGGKHIMIPIKDVLQKSKVPLPRGGIWAQKVQMGHTMCKRKPKIDLEI